MKKRICFVGLRDAEIAALGTTAGRPNVAWESLVSPDCASATSLLAAENAEAVVADLTSLGSAAAELFQTLASSHPRTLRFALGDVADHEAVASSIGAPYQFISRPWKLQDLILIVERSLGLDAWLSSDYLRGMIPRLGRLPSLPSIYFEVVKKAESPNASVDCIAEVIARDPTLTARLLQMVNSAVCGQAKKVTSPEGAVAILGVDTVKSVVLCLQIFNASTDKEQSLEGIWRRSFAVAQMSRKIVLHQAGDARFAGDAFTAGLLHKIGQIILATNLGEEYRSVLEAARPGRRAIAEAEKATLGVTSEQIGAYLLGLWGMPLSVIEAVALCQTPSLTVTREFSLLTAVHVAAALVEEEGGGGQAARKSKLDSEYLEALHLPSNPAAWRKLLRNGVPQPPPGEECEPATPIVPLERPAKLPRLRRSALAFALFLLAALIFALVAKHRPAAFSPTSSAPAPAVEARREQHTGFDSVKVEGMFARGGRPTVIINGQICAPGDVINGVSVRSIARSGVELEYQGNRKTVNVDR